MKLVMQLDYLCARIRRKRLQTLPWCCRGVEVKPDFGDQHIGSSSYPQLADSHDSADSNAEASS